MMTCLYLSVTPEKAPDKETEYVTMTFEARCSEDIKWQSNESFRYHHRAEQTWRRNMESVLLISLRTVLLV